MLSLLLLVLYTDPAAACWACDPNESKESCEQSIIQSQHEQINGTRARFVEHCQAHPGEHFAFGMSTLGSVNVRCDQDGGGCLHWVATLPSSDDKFFKLGSDDTCSQTQIAGFRRSTPSGTAVAAAGGAAPPKVDEQGFQISSLGD